MSDTFEVPDAPESFGSAPKKNNKTLLIILAVVAVLIICCCCVAVIAGIIALFTAGTGEFYYHLLPVLNLA